MTVLLGLESQLSEEQKTGPLFFALKKMAPRLVKDMATVPEERLKEGMRGLALAVLWAVDPSSTLHGATGSDTPALEVLDGTGA